MKAYIVRRVGQGIVVLFLVTVIVFIVIRLIPGDPAVNMAGPDASSETIAEIRQSLGLGRPLPVQYGTWVAGLLHGNFGESFATRGPVTAQLNGSILATLELTVLAMAYAVVVGVALGIIAAYRRGRLMDRLIDAVSLGSISLPPYWLALLLVLLFSVTLRWFPSGGNTSWQSYILPIVALGTIEVGMLTRLTRASFIEVLSQDYIRLARLKGIPQRRLLFRHALVNGLVSVMTFVGIQLGHVLAGAVVIEVVFAWPGLGRLAVDSLLARDLPTVQAVILVFAVIVLLVNLVTDILYRVIDPRMVKNAA